LGAPADVILHALNGRASGPLATALALTIAGAIGLRPQQFLATSRERRYYYKIPKAGCAISSQSIDRTLYFVPNRNSTGILIILTYLSA
jgi:hypothetical protein